MDTPDAAQLQAKLESLRLGLAHELRTPLAVIRMKAELLSGAEGAAIVAEVDRACGILDGLLDDAVTTVGGTDLPL